MASAVDERRLISPYRKLLNQLSDQLTREDLDKLKRLCVDHIPRGKAEHIQSGLQFFDLLEQDSKIHQRDLGLLEDMFYIIGRMDIVSRIRTFSRTFSYEEDHYQKDEPSLGAFADQQFQPFHSQLATRVAFDDADVVTDGGRDDLDGHQEGGQRVKAATGPAVQAALLSRSPCPASFVNTNGQCGEASDHMRSVSAGAETDEALVGAMARVGACPQVQPDSYSASPSMRYVDFMEFQGYAVQIIGGKHFMTPEGEFVEMNSGVQYKIRVINTHAEGCNLDISIDGYDVGGWVLKGSEELIIERPASEAKRFTFYRVKTAPKEAGIESGRSENGVIRCVFTPEAIQQGSSDDRVVHGSSLVTRNRNSEGVPPLRENHERLLDEERKLEQLSEQVLYQQDMSYLREEQNIRARLERINSEQVLYQRDMSYLREEQNLRARLERTIRVAQEDVSRRMEKISRPEGFLGSVVGVAQGLQRLAVEGLKSLAEGVFTNNVEEEAANNVEEEAANNVEEEAAGDSASNPVAQGPTSLPGRRVTQKDPAWKSGGTTLQGNSRQMFAPAEPIKVDCSRKVELLLRLVAREDEEVGMFSADECKPLSTLYPSAVPE